MYGAKHGGFTSLRQLPGLMGGGGGRPSSPASVPHGVAGGDGRHPSLGSGGWAGLDANNGAPSAAYGPIGGPCTGSTARTTIYNASSAATAMYGDYGGVAPGLHSPPQTPSPLAPQPTKRSSRCASNCLVHLSAHGMPAGSCVLLSQRQIFACEWGTAHRISICSDMINATTGKAANLASSDAPVANTGVVLQPAVAASRRLPALLHYPQQPRSAAA